MITSEITYKGGLRTECLHSASGDCIRTDAPKDNHGKGEAFSPTDLLATSLGACALTTMAILAQREDLRIDLEGTKVSVIKSMAADPRRVSEVEIVITFNMKYEGKTRKMLENAALHCPVARSLHPDLIQKIKFCEPL